MRPSRRSTMLTTLLSIAVSGLLVASGLLAAPAAAVPAGPGAAVPTASRGPAAPVACDAVGTPAPVDESEVVAPGETTPTPLPVPDPPIGGERLAGCAVIADPAAGPVPGELTSSGWLIADLQTGDIIAAKNPHGRFRPASTIKVLLALVALEELDLADPLEATATDWSMEGDACGVGPGGRYTTADVITGLLVVSGNDCANMLARALGGYDETLAKMNAKAAALGAKDTRAATPSGLDAAGMSTSAYDLALIFRAAMADDEFRRLIALPTYQFPGYPPRPDVPGDEDHPGYQMGTSNTLLRDGVPGMTVLGGKTGYTDDALKTFVGAAERDGRELVIVQLHGLSEPGNSYHDQAIAMFEYGFAAAPDVSVGSLETTGERDGLPGRLGASFQDSAALGALPLILLVVALLTAAALVLFALRKARRRR